MLRGALTVPRDFASTPAGLAALGELPELLVDARTHSRSASLPLVQRLPVGAHLAVPLRTSDGRLLGAFGSLSRTGDETLTDRDLDLLRLVAELVGGALEREAQDAVWRKGVVRDVSRYCAGDLEVVFQPIVDLRTGEAAGYEALSRFPGSDRRPERWFADAADVGWGERLECVAVETAVAHLPQLPAGRYLSVNVSPRTVSSPRLRELVSEVDGRRLVLEVTEHTSIEDSPELAAALADLRSRGVRIAVDDAGSGYAGLRQILGLRPDILKLDLSLTSGIADDAARQALAWSLSWFARRAGATLVAEGVENGRDLDALGSLGVGFGQGFLFGRPGPLGAAVTGSFEN